MQTSIIHWLTITCLGVYFYSLCIHNIHWIEDYHLTLIMLQQLMALVPIQIFFYIFIYIIFTIDLAYIILSNVSLSTSSSLPVTLASSSGYSRATSTGTHVISDERLRFRSSAFPINIFLSEARLPASRSKHIPVYKNETKKIHVCTPTGTVQVLIILNETVQVLVLVHR